MSVTKRVRSKNGKKKVFYQAEVFVRGVRLRSRAFDTLGAAHFWHDEQKSKLEHRIEETPEEPITFDECLELFITERLPTLRKSYQQSSQLRLMHLKGPLRGIRMPEFNAKVVDGWLTWLIQSPTARNRGRKTFKAELKMLSTVLNWYRNYKDATFVIPIVKRHRERTRYKSVAPRRPDYYIRPDDLRAWISWLREHRKPVYWRLATFMVLTGTRVGEACGLMWDQVNLEDRVARVIRVVNWDQRTKEPSIEECTKTEESVRILLLPQELVNILEEMKQESNGEGSIFKSSKGELLRYNAVQSAFNAGFEKLKLPWRSTHICRHTFATSALIATKDLGAVQASLGHKSRVVTERYAKAVALLDKATADKTANFLNLSAVNLPRK
ncbi:MAG: site-specific integrase [Bdellovibrionia bacterium]